MSRVRSKFISSINEIQLGPELLSNGTFDTNSAGWSFDFGWSYDAVRQAIKHEYTGAFGNANTTVTGLIIGNWYLLQYEIIELFNERNRFNVSTSINTAFEVVDRNDEYTVGKYTLRLQAKATSGGFGFRAGVNLFPPIGGEICVIDNVSLREIL